MFFQDNVNFKAGIFVLIVIASFFISESLFINIYPLTGAVFLGLLLNKNFITTGIFMVIALIPVIFDNELAMSFAIYYPFLFAFFALLLDMLNMKNKGNLIFYITMAIMIIFAGYMLVMEKELKLFSNTIAAVNAEVNAVGQQFKEISSEENFRDYVNFVKSITNTYAPFLFVFQYVFYNVINMYILSLFFKNMPVPFSEKFSFLQIPLVAVWGINIGLIAYLFTEEPLKTWGLNFILFFLSLYFFQGLSLLTLFCKANGIPVFFLVFFIVVLLANQAMWLLISIVGVLDTLFNFKKYLIKEA